jgi:hypothetical protein
MSERLRHPPGDSGLDGEELAARLRDDAEFAALFEAALDAGVRSAYDQKIQLLARVVAQAANDTATVDDAELVASTIRVLEPPHVRALVTLGHYKLQNPDASGVAAVIEGMAGLRTRLPGKVSGSSQVLRVHMGVSADVADSVTATLEREGLVWNDPPGFGAWGTTDYGQRILDLLRHTKIDASWGQPPFTNDLRWSPRVEGHTIGGMRGRAEDVTIME